MRAQLLMLAACLGLVLGLLGASTIVVARERQAKVAALLSDAPPEGAVDVIDSVGGDLAQADVVDTTTAQVVPAPGEVVTEAETDLRDAQQPAPSRTVSRELDGDREAGADSTPDVGLHTEQLARLFAEMEASAAASVLSQMEDAHIEMVLSLMEERHASAILSNLPPERAAVIIEQAIQSERSF